MQTVIDNFDLLLEGLSITVQLCLYIILIGSFLGLLGGIGLLFATWPIRIFLRAYVDIARGTPLLVLMFLSFYGLPAIGVGVSGFQTAVLSLSLFAGAHISEIVRGAVVSIPAGQTDAAKAIGLTFWPRLRYVILPQLLPAILPPWMNTAVEMVKATSLVALVGVGDLLRSAQEVLERTSDAMPVYLAAAGIYVVINFSLSRLGIWMERRVKVVTAG
jgi:polar amino acid transport system permease protein